MGTSDSAMTAPVASLPPFDVPTVSRITLIRVEHRIGEGIEGDPVRMVIDYYGDDGKHFMREDDWTPKETP